LKRAVQKMGARKIIISDIDDVLTIDRAINEKAIKRIKKMVDSGISVALITANTETRVRDAVMPVLEKYGLVGKVPLFCELGLYELVKNGKIFSPEAKKFAKTREGLLKSVFGEAKKIGLELIPDKEAHLVTIKINAPRAKGAKIPKPEDLAKTRQLIEQTIARQGLSKKVHLEQTKRGFDIIPTGVDKSTATATVLRKWGLREGNYKGFAFGDQFRDRKLAKGKKMKFVEVIEAGQFLKKTSFMKTRFAVRDVKRQVAGVKRKIGPKGRKILRLGRKRHRP